MEGFSPLTAAHSDTWVQTGEIGYLDREDFLHHLGRMDEVLTVAGLKIIPQEIEEKLQGLYPNCELYVVGIPNPTGETAEVPVLCYVQPNDKPIAPRKWLQHWLITLSDTSCRTLSTGFLTYRESAA